jgi:hypothetical protein
MKDLSRPMGMDNVRITPYHPQCDGMVKRMNRTILDILSKFCSHRPSEWDRLLQLVLGAYRSAPHASTGYSPAEKVYGRKIRLPAHLLADNQPAEPDDPASYMEALETHQRTAHKAVDAAVIAEQERQARSYNENLSESANLTKVILCTKPNQGVPDNLPRFESVILVLIALLQGKERPITLFNT